MHLKKELCCWLMGAGILTAAANAPAQISLASTVDLALQNSPQIRIATANVQSAEAGLAQTKDVYIPSFVLGSGVGYTYGFPVGQPSVFNAAAQSLVFSFAQPDYVRAAGAALKAARLKLKDDKDQVTLDCAMAYLQLEIDTEEIVELEREKADAESLVSIEQQRVNAGVASRMDETKAEITSAQVDLNRFHIQDDANVQRLKLAHLTGMPAASFVPISVPPLPDLSNDSSLQTAVANNAGIQASDANAKSKFELSNGDAKQYYRPQFGFGVEYNRYAEFNNYQDYYRRFQHNNFDVGVQITFPIFDAAKRAKARQSAAEAARASAEAEQARNQTTEQVASLRHSLDELKAQQRLAQLQSAYAQEQLEAVQSELKNGTGSPNAAPVTPRDEELASIEMEERRLDVLKANLSVMQAQLSLMRSIGTIGEWAHLHAK